MEIQTPATAVVPGQTASSWQDAACHGGLLGDLAQRAMGIRGWAGGLVGDLSLVNPPGILPQVKYHKRKTDPGDDPPTSWEIPKKWRVVAGPMIDIIIYDNI